MTSSSDTPHGWTVYCFASEGRAQRGDEPMTLPAAVRIEDVRMVIWVLHANEFREAPESEANVALANQLPSPGSRNGEPCSSSLNWDKSLSGSFSRAPTMRTSSSKGPSSFGWSSLLASMALSLL